MVLWRQVKRKSAVEMSESESGNLILYSVFHRKPVQFKEKRGVTWSCLDFSHPPPFFFGGGGE